MSLGNPTILYITAALIFVLRNVGITAPRIVDVASAIIGAVGVILWLVSL